MVLRFALLGDALKILVIDFFLKGFRLLGMAGLVALVIGCETTRKVQVTEASTQPTWEGAEIAIPVGVGGVNCSGYVYRDCLERVSPAGKMPVIVYMHGCDGPNAEPVRQLLRAGYVVVAPNSLRRNGRPAVDCVPGSDKQAILKLRMEEAAYAARKLRALPWVDAEKLVLAGFSEGGVTAALYPGDEFAARVILGWTCTSGWSFWQGIRGPRVPTLAIVGSADHYYANRYNRGRCNVSGRPNSNSIVVQGAGHNIIVMEEVWNAVGEFLRTVLPMAADQKSPEGEG